MIDTARVPVPMEDHSEATVDEIINRMCNGHLLSEICEDNGFPLPSQVRQHAVDNAEFGGRFHRAVEVQAHMLFEEAVVTARTSNEKSVNLNKFKADVLMKAAGKLLPKVYGDKADVSNVIPIQINMNLGGVSGKIAQKSYNINTEDTDNIATVTE